MPAGGSIRLEVERAAPNEAMPGDTVSGRQYVRLRITDDGVGMDEATRDHAFDAFFTTKPERGTGLGLWVVKGVVSDCGGRIGIESAPGKGTTVSVWLPAAQSTPGTPVEARPSTGTDAAT